MSDIQTTSKEEYPSITDPKRNLQIKASPGRLSILKPFLRVMRHVPENYLSKAENQGTLLLNLLIAGRAFRFAEGSRVRLPAGSQVR